MATQTDPASLWNQVVEAVRAAFKTRGVPADDPRLVAPMSELKTLYAAGGGGRAGAAAFSDAAARGPMSPARRAELLRAAGYTAAN